MPQKIKSNQIRTCAFNNKLKYPGQDIEFTEFELSEYIKCKQDIIYFSKYCKVVTLDQGLVPFEPWDFQIDILRAMQHERFVVVCASRQIGKSLLYSIFATWMLIFSDYKKIVMLANKLATVSSILNDKVKICYENLPLWMQHGIETWNTNSFILENHSSISISGTTSDSVRGISANILIIDECAFINTRLYEEFQKSSFPVISGGQTSKILMVSTPNGYNHFETIFTKAKLKKNQFIPFEIMWNQRPDRDEKWKQGEIDNMGETQFRQEYCCEFQGTTGSLVQGSILKKIVDSVRDVVQIDPSSSPLFSRLEKYFNNIKVFHLPEPGHIYISSHDSATNTDEESGDSACIQIIDITELPFRQVCCADFIDDTAYLEIPYVQVELCKIYNQAFVFNENNDGAGRESNYIIVNEICYENVFWEKPKVPGFRTTASTKSRGCANLKAFLEHGFLKLYDTTTIHQLFQFVRSKGSYAATDKNHDDSVMALIGALFFLQMEQETIEEFFGNVEGCYYRLPSIQELLKIVYTSKHEDIEEAVEITDEGIEFKNEILNNPNAGMTLNQMIDAGMSDPATIMRAMEKRKNAVKTLRGAEYDDEGDMTFTGLPDDSPSSRRHRTVEDMIFGDW